MSAARRFKASWFELGEALTRVRREERWKKWGHSTFDDYCRKELHLKRETADKLTGSFSFLRSRAPEVVERAFSKHAEDEQPLPAYGAVDFWRRAEESEAPAETLDQIRRQVLDEGASLPRLNRQFREVLFPLGDDEQREKRRTELRNTTSRLTELLAHAREEGIVPATLSAELEEPLQRLAALVAKAPVTAAA